MLMPRVVISGLSGGVGKTMVSLGICRAFTRRGVRVHPFKKGPDYIDTGWLALAAGTRAGNLDPYFLDGGALLRHFFARAAGADLAVIEGNRGFFDGRDVAGSASTAEVARHVDAPVILVVDITKMTRTTAALVAGCKAFPGGGRVAGVILNRGGGRRHAAIARASVEELAGVPVFGVLPRLADAPIFERRAGLITVDMHGSADDSLERTADLLEKHVDLDAILALARSAPALIGRSAPALIDRSAPALVTPEDGDASSRGMPRPSVRIGVARDAALWEYYAENLDALREAGADLVFVPLLGDAPWPELDGLYLGGGDLSPYAAALAANTARKRDLRARIEQGMPVYAEHAGFFYLGKSYAANGETHEMAGIFPVEARITEKPARLGYVDARVLRDTLFYPAGYAFKGHEYHYARLSVANASGTLEKHPGADGVADSDGLVYKAAFGAAMQVFAPAVPVWGAGFVRAAEAWRQARI